MVWPFEEQSCKLGQCGIRERKHGRHCRRAFRRQINEASTRPLRVAVRRFQHLPVCTPLQHMSCVATTGLPAGMKTTCMPILRGPLMVSLASLHSSPSKAVISLLNSRPRLYRPPRPASLHIQIPKHALPDDVFHECSSLAERICRLHFHFLRPRHQKFKKCPFQGRDRSLQGL